MLDATRGIYAQTGIRGLYRGLGVTLVEIIPYASLQFGLYDAFNQAWTRLKVRDVWGHACEYGSQTSLTQGCVCVLI